MKFGSLNNLLLIFLLSFICCIIISQFVNKFSPNFNLSNSKFFISCSNSKLLSVIFLSINIRLYCSMNFSGLPNTLTNIETISIFVFLKSFEMYLSLYLIPFKLIGSQFSGSSSDDK